MLRAWTASMARLIAARSDTGPGRHDNLDLVVEDDETEGVGGGEAVDDVAQGALGVVERRALHRPAAVEDDHQVGGGRVRRARPWRGPRPPRGGRRGLRGSARPSSRRSGPDRGVSEAPCPAPSGRLCLAA